MDAEKHTAALIINEAVGMAMRGSVSESISYLEMIKRIYIGISSCDLSGISPGWKDM